MRTKAKRQRTSSAESVYGACTKKTLLRLAKTVGIKPTPKISREQLLEQIDAEKPRITLQSEDLLSPLRPFLSAINREINQTTTSGREQDLAKEKLLEVFGTSLSRLPYLTSKTIPSKKDWMAVQTISMNLELLHDILGTTPICRPGEALRYDLKAHEGPSRMEEGQPCVAISTGIKREDLVILKALVIATEEK